MAGARDHFVELGLAHDVARAVAGLAQIQELLESDQLALRVRPAARGKPQIINREERQLVEDYSDKRVMDISITSESLRLVLLQLRALKLIQVKVREYTEVWHLTEYGDDYMARLLAVPKKKRKK